jgi:hypothetical protein
MSSSDSATNLSKSNNAIETAGVTTMAKNYTVE